MDISRIKKVAAEPSVYAIIIRSTLGQALYLGVHFTLDEAYLSAQKKFETLGSGIAGEITNLEIWSSLAARDILAQFVEPGNIEAFINSIIDPGSGTPITGAEGFASHIMKIAVKNKDYKNVSSAARKAENLPSVDIDNSVEDYVISAKAAKNALMKKIIEGGDASKIDKLKSVLNSYDRRYLADTIEKQVTLKKMTSLDNENKV